VIAGKRFVRMSRLRQSSFRFFAASVGRSISSYVASAYFWATLPFLNAVLSKTPRTDSPETHQSLPHWRISTPFFARIASDSTLIAPAGPHAASAAASTADVL